MAVHEPSLIIPAQLGFYEEQAEAWDADHRAATASQDLEAIISLGLCLFASILRADHAWSGQVQAGKIAFEETDARQFGHWYAHWLRPCDALLVDIAELEEEGYEVTGAAEFRRACVEVRAKLSIPLECLLHVSDNKNSIGRSIADVRN